MIHNFQNTEIWEDKASNTQKLIDSKLASPPTYLLLRPILSFIYYRLVVHITNTIEKYKSTKMFGHSALKNRCLHTTMTNGS